jgi:hypothetical protein
VTRKSAARPGRAAPDSQMQPPAREESESLESMGEMLDRISAVTLFFGLKVI